MRAPLFTGTLVVAAARSARARGADVVLLDDSLGDELAAEDRRRIIEAVVNVVGRAGSGSEVVARVLPPGRRHLASILIDDDTLLVSPATPDDARGTSRAAVGLTG